MDEYIKRSDVLCRIEVKAQSLDAMVNHNYRQALSDVYGLVYDIPTADVVEVKRGKWIKHYKSGMTVNGGYVSSCCDMWNERKSNYCPNCGAKMEGKDGVE